MPNTTIQPYHGSYLMPSLEHATVADVMHPGIISCETDTTMTEMARIMATHHVHCVAIMHPAQGQSGAPYLWGIVSDLDLMRASISPSEEGTAGAVAQQPTISVKPTVPLRDAAEVMLRNKTSHVVVIHPETLRPIGVLSTLDIAGVVAWGEA
ncbi:MAG: CBS domain-containing protein [Solirubrobacteraceae bacterium]